jgi:hypothetical protein
MKTKYHILELMKVKTISWTFYMIMDYQCLVTIYIFQMIYLSNFLNINILTLCQSIVIDNAK